MSTYLLSIILQFLGLQRHIEVVSAPRVSRRPKIITTGFRVDPSADNNYAIHWASSKGHVEVIKLLLADSRVDPSDENNYAICWASKYGHVELI